MIASIFNLLAKFDRATCLLVVICLSFVIEITIAFSPIVSVLRFQTFSSVSLRQSNNSDDDAPKPFFFTGEARSEIENEELRRVFLGVESLQEQREENVGPSIDSPDVFTQPMLDIERERENLERMFRL